MGALYRTLSTRQDTLAKLDRLSGKLDMISSQTVVVDYEEEDPDLVIYQDDDEEEEMDVDSDEESEGQEEDEDDMDQGEY